MSRIILGFNKNAFLNKEREKEFRELLTNLEKWVSIASHPSDVLRIEVGANEVEGIKKELSPFLKELVVQSTPKINS